MGLALRVGVVFAALGLILAIAGILRGAVPLNPLSIFLALLISGGGWGLVSWAIATAVVDVERDVERGDDEDEMQANGLPAANEGERSAGDTRQ
jgi:hypothetical protein